MSLPSLSLFIFPPLREQPSQPQDEPRLPLQQRPEPHRRRAEAGRRVHSTSAPRHSPPPCQVRRRARRPRVRVDMHPDADRAPADAADAAAAHAAADPRARLDPEVRALLEELDLHDPGLALTVADLFLKAGEQDSSDDDDASDDESLSADRAWAEGDVVMVDGEEVVSALRPWAAARAA